MKPKKVNLALPINMIEKTSKKHAEFIELLNRLYDYIARYKGYIESLNMEAILRLPSHKLKEIDGWVKGFLKRASQIDRDSSEFEKSLQEMVDWFVSNNMSTTSKKVD